MSKFGKIVADFSTQLYSKISVGGETAKIVSNKDADGVNIPDGRYYFTIDGNNSRKEHIVCTVTGVDLTNIKSVSRQGVETTGVTREHRIGAIITITDFAHIKNVNDVFTGDLKLDPNAPLEYSSTPTISRDNQLATRKFVEGVQNAGGIPATSTATGITRLSVDPAEENNPIAVGNNDPRVPSVDEKGAMAGTGTPSGSNKFVTYDTLVTGINKKVDYICNYVAGENITVSSSPIPVNLNPATGTVFISRANSSVEKYRLGFLGFALHSASMGESVAIQTTGIIHNFLNLTPFVDYYVQDDLGVIGTTTGSIAVTKVGTAVSSTSLMIYTAPKFEVVTAALTNTLIQDSFVVSHKLGVAPKRIKIRGGNSNSGGSSYHHYNAIDFNSVWVNNGSQLCFYNFVKFGGDYFRNSYFSNYSPSACIENKAIVCAIPEGGTSDYEPVFGSITDVSPNTFTITLDALKHVNFIIIAELEA